METLNKINMNKEKNIFLSWSFLMIMLIGIIFELTFNFIKKKLKTWIS